MSIKTTARMAALAACSFALPVASQTLAPGNYIIKPMHTINDPAVQVGWFSSDFAAVVPYAGLRRIYERSDYSFMVTPHREGGVVLRFWNPRHADWDACATVARNVALGPARIDLPPCDAAANARSRCDIGAPDQRFYPRAVGPNLYELRTGNGLCWDVRGAGRNDGTDLVAWDCNGQPQQRFEFTAALDANGNRRELPEPVARCVAEAAPRALPTTAGIPRLASRAPIAQPSAGDSAAAANTPRAITPFEVGRNRLGADLYRRPGVGDAAACAAQCRSDGDCQSWVWVKPGVQGPAAVCYLKGAVPPAQDDPCCTTGLKY